MKAIGVGVGIPFGRSRGWITQTDKTLWVKEDSRNGLTLTNSLDVDNSPTILPAIYSKRSKTDYAVIRDNGSLDIGNSDFTFGGWCKVTEKLTTGMLFGKSVVGSAVGRYGVYYNATTGYITFICQESGGTKTINSTIDATSDWHFILVDINQTTKKIRLFIDNEQIGSEISYTGSFSSMDNAYGFLVGAANTVNTGAARDIAASIHAETFIYRSILTPENQTALFNRQYVSGATAFWPMLRTNDYIFDLAGNYHLTCIGEKVIEFSAYGSRYGFDYGYTLCEDSFGKAYIPLRPNGDEIDISSYNLIHRLAKHEGNPLRHNLCDSAISFVGAEWDRSDTTRFSDLARSLKYGYDASNPKVWWSELLNNLLFQSWANDNYKGFNFVKINDHSYKERKVLNSIVTTQENQTGDSYAKAMQWAGDYVFENVYENDYLYWELSSVNQFAVSGNKSLRFETGKVYLSLDNGGTWPYLINISGLTAITSGFIFPNGNILFSGVQTTAKVWLSTDNLATINEIRPTDLNGDDFYPSDIYAYVQANVPIINTIGTKDVFVSPVYSRASLAISPVWYSVDNGATLKMAFLPGTTEGVTARHWHGVVFNPNNNTFMLYSGDVTDECNIYEATYNDIADTWSIIKLLGDSGTYYKFGGIAFNGDYIYWASDTTTSPNRTIYRCLYSDFGTTSAYEKLLDNGKVAWDCKIIDGNLFSRNIVYDIGEFGLLLGKDLDVFMNIPFYNKVITTRFAAQTVLGKNADGWIIISYQDNGALYYSLAGDVLKVKIK